MDFLQDTGVGFFHPDTCDLAEFDTLISQKLAPDTVPNAVDICDNVPIYDMAALRPQLEDAAKRASLLAEWARGLNLGSGAVVLRHAYSDTAVIDEATTAYTAIIEDEKQSSGGGADHFAAAGTNDRVWNSLQKLCEKAPDIYLRYFANPSIAAMCEAWLGPNYQMTAQVNLVHPGGAAQLAHRDYHLGFQTAQISASYPTHVHDLSPRLTLQGAIAHCDMPIESGPTKLLPFSQLYRPGYVAWRRDDFRALFEDRHIQLPLAKGDALFFSPALFHAAGSNTSANIHRMANLLQVSSAFGRAMETIDRRAMCALLFSHALKRHQNASLSALELDAAIAATAEGYSFPTNLDRDPPVGGLAPETQAALFKRALEEGMTPDAFAAQLDALASRQLA